MRCGRAQKLMTAAVDGELSPRERHTLDRHVAGCETCGRELAETDRMLSALERLPMEIALSAGLEQATLRRVRLAAAEEGQGAAPRWRLWLPIPAFALATAAVLALAFGIVRRTPDIPGSPTLAPTLKSAGEEKVATAVPQQASRLARGEKSRRADSPSEPPPQLAAAPDLFMNLPILRNLEKLQHFEAIQTTTLDDEPGTPGGQEQPSNG